MHRTTSEPPDDHTPACAQSTYSEPGRHARLLARSLADPPVRLDRIARLARNVIVHDRSTDVVLPEATAGEIHLRKLAEILETDQARHGTPLDAPRPAEQRVQSCCRDHTLFCVGALRLLGVPARSRVGFAGYLSPDWHHDHVVAETWMSGRWVRFDPEITGAQTVLTVTTDLPTEPGSSFLTAAQVWLGYRSGRIDVDRFGVAAGSGLTGSWYAFNSVIDEVAHRFGDELLLWDVWGAKVTDLSAAPTEDLDLVDRTARLLLAADQDVPGAEEDLLALYTGEPRLRPPRPFTAEPGADRPPVSGTGPADPIHPPHP